MRDNGGEGFDGFNRGDTAQRSRTQTAEKSFSQRREDRRKGRKETLREKTSSSHFWFLKQPRKSFSGFAMLYFMRP